ncbi:MAG: hypothetical protein IKM93_08360 [Bacteroidales bacterium]|nr:hypothetical protein [Bacteroidales bacterium]
MKRILIFLFFFLFIRAAGAQDLTVVRDTLPAAVKVADRAQRVRADGYKIDPVKTRRVVSPLGDGDAVKYILTLPGVTMGGEGGSAIYVRGGNMGSNLMTLDGVPLYGISHLLGLTTVYPGDVIGATEFHAGGFSSEEGNFTASHIRLQTKTGDFVKTGGDGSLTPFLASASVSAPIVKDKVSFLGSFRVSPLGLEYKAARNTINKYQDVLQDFNTTVGDAFGKVSWKVNPHNDLSLSAFGSLDRYGFVLNDKTTDGMGWSNVLVNLAWENRGIESFDHLHTAASFNRHAGTQSSETVLDGSYNRFEVRSTLTELTLLSTATKSWGRWNSQFGVKVRGARFNPGSSRRFDGSTYKDAEESPLVDSYIQTVLSTLHGQLEYQIPDKFLLRMAVRGNAYAYGVGGVGGQSGWLFHPEGSLTARVHLLRQFGVEATADALTQYYHTLEGIPLGWSVDMVVPSDKTNPPEQALQGYAGMFGGIGNHTFRAGGFYKLMRNLVYYGDATQFFSSALAGWHENISIGEGTSYGAEFLYEKDGEILSWRASYTWSKTDRYFPDLNRGRRFPAKYDRRHVANASVDWTILRMTSRTLSFNTQFTYQSGSWETLQDGALPGFFIGQKDWISMPMISSLNNYELPPYIRWDAALHLDLKGHRANHEIGLGVYNLLNRHNPFMLRYNPDTHAWNLVSLLPILPSITWRISW